MRRLAASTGIAALAITIVAADAAMRPAPATHEASAADTLPRPIARGGYEPSGVAHVPGTRQFLFVDDNSRREIFMMEIAAGGAQQGQATRVSLGADVTDMEAMTHDGARFYLVGSQSKRRGHEGDGLVRFRYDPATRQVSDLETMRGLKAWLARNVAELRGTERRTGDEVLNIEALAWDPRSRRLLLGLRAPVVDGHALVVPVRLADTTASFATENLRADGPAIRLQLNGAGIRSLEYDAHAGSFRVIAGAALNDETEEFRVYEWNGEAGQPTRLVSAWPAQLKPEGIVRAELDGRPVSMIVFDVGQFAIVD